MTVMTETTETTETTALELPRTMSPSKLSSFTDCALAFRFAVIDRLPEPPSPWATKGTLVHAALERLLLEPPPRRTLEVALEALATAYGELRDHPDVTGLALDAEAELAFVAEAEALVRRYFELEDPRRVRPIGLEIKLAAEVGGVVLRGIIDRLELDDGGDLVITDYKTGRTPSERHERHRLEGVHLYALLCERVIGRRPARVQLFYLAEPVAIICTPSDRSVRSSERKLSAVWAAVERASLRDDFRPHPSGLCDYCAFQAFCPAFGGDPAAARRLGQLRETATAV
ncbi:MAG: RecB family exonuclease [Acidimicrobiales bacterium]